ncbi:MAG: hypothetical protein AAB568_00595 [Patescibacteria group bacterium]
MPGEKNWGEAVEETLDKQQREEEELKQTIEELSKDYLMQDKDNFRKVQDAWGRLKEIQRERSRKNALDSEDAGLISDKEAWQIMASQAGKREIDKQKEKPN